MAPRDHDPPKAQLVALHAKLIAWLVEEAYPHWAQHGIDARNGGFCEALGQHGRELAHPRRARVQARQIYSFAQARSLGWRGDMHGIVRRGADYLATHYLRGDGLYRALAAIDGTALDERAPLYDQAFALLGLAAAAVALDARGEFEQRALALRAAIERRLGTADGSLRSAEDADALRESNPHMHVLESALAWAEIGSDPGWAAWATTLVDLAVTRFIHSGSGALREVFTAEWRAAPGLPGRLVEPGHQFEWAWLLMRSEALHPAPLRPRAFKLMAIGEDSGVRNGVAVNALLDDLSLHDPNARLWPQTERLKSALLAAQLTGEARYWHMARSAASGLLPYLNTPIRGLWFDVRLPGGEFVDSPAIASSFYHLVCAIVALDKAVKAF
jgi:mannose/cellobiose epimerase-like protein (N-acyl-D-glucosamine 2-epimerase family)